MASPVARRGTLKRTDDDFRAALAKCATDNGIKVLNVEIDETDVDPPYCTYIYAGTSTLEEALSRGQTYTRHEYDVVVHAASRDEMIRLADCVAGYLHASGFYATFGPEALSGDGGSWAIGLTAERE